MRTGFGQSAGSVVLQLQLAPQLSKYSAPIGPRSDQFTVLGTRSRNSASVSLARPSSRLVPP